MNLNFIVQQYRICAAPSYFDRTAYFCRVPVFVRIWSPLPVATFLKSELLLLYRRQWNPNTDRVVIDTVVVKFTNQTE